MENLRKIGQLHNTAQLATSQILMATLKTSIEMLKDRGYTNIQSCQTLDEVKQGMCESRCIVCGNGDRSVHIYFHNEDRVGVKQLRSWVESSTADNVIVVSLEGPTAFTRKEAETQCPHVRFFLFSQLCVNITKHSLVPKHEKVSALPMTLSAEMTEVPSLFTTDAVCQYYGYEPQSIIRITRTVGAHEPMYYYRIVRRPPA